MQFQTKQFEISGTDCFSKSSCCYYELWCWLLSQPSYFFYFIVRISNRNLEKPHKILAKYLAVQQVFSGIAAKAPSINDSGSICQWRETLLPDKDYVSLLTEKSKAFCDFCAVNFLYHFP